MKNHVARKKHHNHHHYLNLSLVFNGVSDSLFLIKIESNLTFRVLEVNQSYLDVTGFKKENLINKPPEEVLEGEALEFVLTKYNEAIHKKIPLQYEETVDLPIGRRIFEVKLTPICPNGVCTHLLGAMRDITEQIKTEELLRKTDMLAVAGQLAASIAHEIRNPLTSLKGFLQLIENTSNPKKEYFDILHSELERIEYIVNELLVLVKPKKGNFNRLHIDLLILQTLRIINPQALLINVTFENSFEENLPTIYGNDKQLKQVFINILKNALEDMPNGGKIIIQIERTEKNYVVIRFIDQGKGIPQEIISKLGEAFFTTKEQGTGLGLMVSEQIIQNHRGRLVISSELNKGTTVEVYLPFT